MMLGVALVALVAVVLAAFGLYLAACLNGLTAAVREVGRELASINERVRAGVGVEIDRASVEAVRAAVADAVGLLRKLWGMARDRWGAGGADRVEPG